MKKSAQLEDNPVPSLSLTIDIELLNESEKQPVKDAIEYAIKDVLFVFGSKIIVRENGVETDKQQPKIPKDYKLIHQCDDEIIFRKQLNKKCDCANQADSCNNLSCVY